MRSTPIGQMLAPMLGTSQDALNGQLGTSGYVAPSAPATPTPAASAPAPAPPAPGDAMSVTVKPATGSRPAEDAGHVEDGDGRRFTKGPRRRLGAALCFYGQVTGGRL